MLAYCLRFIYNAAKSPKERRSSRLSVAEQRDAHIRLILYTQSTEFREEISDLKSKRGMTPSSKILQLHRFLDEHSSWAFERKHPIILPAVARFSRLLIERKHHRLLNAGQQLLLASIREQYWPLRGRNLARQVCHDCMYCAKNNPRELSQLMGALPSDRVRPSLPFSIAAIDFAGPIVTLVNKGRGRKTNQSYVALSRSDNAINFIGTDNELREMQRFAESQAKRTIGDVLANEGIE